MQRYPEIDQFRGLAILGMILVNFLAGAEVVPTWLKHAPDIGLTIADLIAPMFIFAIGLTYGLSFRQRLQRDGRQKTLSHFIFRSLELIGIGCLLSAGETAVGESTAAVNWGVLQAIGVAQLVVLPFLFLPAWARTASGCGILVLYQVLLDHFWLGPVLASSHGGLLGALSWSAMLLLATLPADIYFSTKGKKFSYLVCAAAIFITGVIWSGISPISKNRVSPAYVLISLGISALVFYVFFLFQQKGNSPSRFLSIWGKNPLALYLLQDLVLAVFVLPPFPGWYRLAPGWLILLQAAALIAILHSFARLMEKKRWILKL